jgi:di/tricarboxylate transporter
MTVEMVLTMIVLVFVIVLFIFEWVRVDVVGILMMVLLPLIGLISPNEAFVGLSSNAVCSIIAVIIIGAGLDKTGVMNQLAGPTILLNDLLILGGGSWNHSACLRRRLSGYACFSA